MSTVAVPGFHEVARLAAAAEAHDESAAECAALALCDALEHPAVVRKHAAACMRNAAKLPHAVVTWLCDVLSTVALARLLGHYRTWLPSDGYKPAWTGQSAGSPTLGYAVLCELCNRTNVAAGSDFIARAMATQLGGQHYRDGHFGRILQEMHRQAVRAIPDSDTLQLMPLVLALSKYAATAAHDLVTLMLGGGPAAMQSAVAAAADSLHACLAALQSRAATDLFARGGYRVIAAWADVVSSYKLPSWSQAEAPPALQQQLDSACAAIRAHLCSGAEDKATASTCALTVSLTSRASRHSATPRSPFSVPANARASGFSRLVGELERAEGSAVLRRYAAARVDVDGTPEPQVPLAWLVGCLVRDSMSRASRASELGSVLTRALDLFMRDEVRGLPADASAALYRDALCAVIAARSPECSSALPDEMRGVLQTLVQQTCTAGCMEASDRAQVLERFAQTHWNAVELVAGALQSAPLWAGDGKAGAWLATTLLSSAVARFSLAKRRVALCGYACDVLALAVGTGIAPLAARLLLLERSEQLLIANALREPLRRVRVGNGLYVLLLGGRRRGRSRLPSELWHMIATDLDVLSDASNFY